MAGHRPDGQGVRGHGRSAADRGAADRGDRRERRCRCDEPVGRVAVAATGGRLSGVRPRRFDGDLFGPDHVVPADSSQRRRIGADCGCLDLQPVPSHACELGRPGIVDRLELGPVRVVTAAVIGHQGARQQHDGGGAAVRRLGQAHLDAVPLGELADHVEAQPRGTGEPELRRVAQLLVGQLELLRAHAQAPVLDLDGEAVADH